jgi:hypothetical protein
LWFSIIDEREYLFIKKRPPKVRCAIDQKLEKREICTRLLAGSDVLLLPKGRLMEEIERFSVRIEVNGKKEVRAVERVEAGGWDLPRLIPRVYQGETLVETPNGYKILRIKQ